MMEPSKNVRIWSLPGGDRRGTSGADAGRHSMQAIGGEGNGRPSAGEPEKSEPTRRYNLRPHTRSRSTSEAGTTRPSRTSREEVGNRRLASIEERSQSRTERAEESEEAQSNLSSPKSLFSSLPSSPPSYLNFISEPSSPSLPSHKSSLAEDVVQSTNVDETAPAPTRPRTRKKWTDEMNIFVLRTYLKITKLESDTRSYLTELHKEFIDQFPYMEVSKQRLGDQRRAIVRNNLLSTAQINDIKKDVMLLLSENQQHTTQHTPNLTQSIQTGQRMKWTTEHNEVIIREYLRITQLETNKTAYRKPLHQHFVHKFPHLSHISEQRIADQRRFIVSNKFISDERLSSIKNEVATEIGSTDPTNNLGLSIIVNNNQNEEAVSSGTNNTNTQHTFTETENNIDTSLLTVELDRNTELDEIFSQALQYFQHTNPETRPYIPKQKASKKLARVVDYLNTINLPEVANSETSFENLQTVVYCAAWTAAKANGSKLLIPPQEIENRTQQSKPRWQQRLERKIKDLRKKIGRLTQYIDGNRNTALNKQVNKILETYKIHTIHEDQNTDLNQFLDTLKQKLSVTSSRLRRYQSCSLRKTQNNQFANNEKKFYQNLSKATTNMSPATTNTQTTQHTEIVDPTELRTFWANIWEQSVEHNKEAEWIASERTRNTNVQEMEFESIPIDVFQNVLKNTHNWKAPGSDNLHNYWYKKFTHIHPYLYNHINNFIQNPDKMPKYFTSGITYMIPKDLNDTTNPAKYRPITCLQTIYKILTACLTQLIYKHIDTNHLLAEQQKGCKKLSQGCKEQLTIDSIILKQVHQKKKDLFTSYIDYQKAYDSVPHSWLISILEIYQINSQIVSFLKMAMSNWSTQLKAQTSKTVIQTESISIRRGIFQGDALSPLWFCLALNPLSNLLNSTNTGYLFLRTDSRTNLQVENPFTLSHLLYMDDIKLYATTQLELEYLIQMTENFSKDIGMRFGIDKCKINSIKSGKNYQHSYSMQTGDTITPLNDNESYKYLGYYQTKLILYKDVKNKLISNFKHRINSILRTQLCAKNVTKAINSFAIPILTYSFGIINWTKKELKDLQRIINVSMTKNRKHHPRSCVQRQILPRIDGGRGIINITNLHNKQIASLRIYFHSKVNTSDLHKVIVQNDVKLTPLNLNDPNKQKNEELTDRQTLTNEWALKSLHGRHQHDLSQPNVDKEASNEWLRRGELFPETEGFMISIQDQVIETRNYQKHIMKIRNLPTDLCRRCNSSSETIQHITGACKMIAQTDYKFRHDQVANIIHQRLAEKYNLIKAATPRPTPYYKYNPETILENSSHKLYYDRAILTDKTIHYNRPDITIVDKINKTALLIDIAIPNTHNLQNTIAEKISKYVDLKDEITRMWRLKKVSIIPIVISSTGIIPTQLFQSLTLLELPKHTFALLQKAVILNTCRIVRKFLQVESRSESDPTNITAHTDVHLA